MQEEYGIKLKILTDSFKNSIMQVKGMIHNFKNDIKQDTDVNFTIDSNLTLKQLQKFKSDIESELAKLQESSKIGAGMKVVDPDEERKIKNLTAGLTMVKERIAEIGNEADDTKQKISGISVSANMTNNTIVNGFKNSWKSIKRFAFSLLSLRGIYGLVRKASSSYMAQDRGLAEQMQRTWASVGAMLAPIIETIVKWIRIGAAYLNYFIKALTGKDLIGKAVKKINKYNKSLGGTAKAAKAVNKELTTMDEVTNLSFDDASTQGIEDAAKAFDDFGDIKLDKKVTDILDKWAKAMKNLWDNLKHVRDLIGDVIKWAIDHPNAVIAILGGAALLDLINKLTGSGLTGYLSNLAAIGIVVAGVDLIYNAITGRDLINDLKEIIDGLKEISNSAKNNKTVAESAAEASKKWGTVVDSLIKKNGKNSKEVDKVNTSLINLEGTNKSVTKAYSDQLKIYNPLSKQYKNQKKAVQASIKEEKNETDALYKLYKAGTMNQDEKKDTIKILKKQKTQYEKLAKEHEYDIELSNQFKDRASELNTVLSNMTGKDYACEIDVETWKAEQDINKTKTDLNDVDKMKPKPLVELQMRKSANDVAKEIKNALGITVNPKAEVKVGTKDAKNKITNFINKTKDAMVFSGILNKFNQATLNALLKAIPAYDVGTNYVPNDQLAMVHKGEAIVPKKFNNEQFFNSNNEETNALLVEVNQNLIELRNRPNILEVNGKELAQATYNDYQNEGSRLNQSMTIKKVGGN